MRTSLLLLIIFSITVNCCINPRDNESKRGDIIKSIEDLRNKEVHIPDSLLLLIDGQKIHVASEDYLKNEIKILTLLNADCRNCLISQLMFWDSFFQEKENMGNLQIIIISLGENDYLEDVLVDEIGISLPIFLDRGHTMLENSFFENPVYNTVLVDENNRILLAGDFRNNMQLESLYKNEIYNRLHPQI